MLYGKKGFTITAKYFHLFSVTSQNKIALINLC